LSEYFLLPLASLPSQHRSGHRHHRTLAVHWYGVGYIVHPVCVVVCQAPRHQFQALAKRQSADETRRPRRFHRLGGDWRRARRRTGYVLFYDLPRYIAHPLDIFAVWQGGMSFHGGLLGVILAMTLFSLKRGIRTWTLFDVVSAGVPVGLGLVASAISSMPSFGAGRPTCPGGGLLQRSPPASAGHVPLVSTLGIRANFTRHCSKVSCCSWCCSPYAFTAQAEDATLHRWRLHLRLRPVAHLRRVFREPDQQLGYLLGTTG